MSVGQFSLVPQQRLSAPLPHVVIVLHKPARSSATHSHCERRTGGRSIRRAYICIIAGYRPVSSVRRLNSNEGFGVHLQMHSNSSHAVSLIVACGSACITPGNSVYSSLRFLVVLLAAFLPPLFCLSPPLLLPLLFVQERMEASSHILVSYPLLLFPRKLLLVLVT